PAFTALIALPIAGYTTFHLMQESPFDLGGGQVADSPVVRQDATTAESAKEESENRRVLTEHLAQPEPAPRAEAPALYAAPEADALSRSASGVIAPAPAEAPRGRVGAVPGVTAASKMMADQAAGG